MTKWREEEDNIIRSYYPKEGKRCFERLTNRSSGSVKTRARVIGVRFDFDPLSYNRVLSSEDRDFIRKYYPIFGEPYCSRKLGKPSLNIYMFADKEKLRKIKPNDLNISEFIEDYLNIWQPSIVYLLGYLWADGYLRKTTFREVKTYTTVVLSIKKSDADAIKKDIEKFDWMEWRSRHSAPVESKLKCGRIIKQNKDGMIAYFLYDKYFCKFLYENDYAIKSGSSADKILSRIPDHLSHYWWRGFFDGDGSFAEKKRVVSLHSTMDQDWTFAKKLCENLGIGYYIEIDNRGNNASRFSIGTANGVLTFLEYIFQNKESDNVGLERKYERFKNSTVERIEVTSEKKGVSYDKTRRFKPWVVWFKSKYVGCFGTEEEAINKRIEVEKDGKIPESRRSQKNRTKKLP